MSNRETAPAELVCENGLATTEKTVQLLDPRDVPLGGPRAMTVRRTLSQRDRSLIGAWCFADHYGPDDVAAPDGMVVPPHPHTGLQTVSWLFAGEIEHRGSAGSHAEVRPGELNLMTAGRGIQHSEISTPNTTVLHGVQLWTVLHGATRHSAPSFEHYVPSATRFGDAIVRVFLGSLIGQHSPASTFSPLIGAQVDLPAGGTVKIPIDAGFEHGVLVDTGELSVEGEIVPVSHLGYLSLGRSSVTLKAGATAVRILLIGGQPRGERIVMWWNFIGRTHEEIVEYRAEWQADVVDGRTADGRFGTVRGYDGRPLPAPVMPNVRLRPRD